MENEDLANGCKLCKKIGPKPPAIPGKTWVIGWTLFDTPKEVVEKSFEKVILDIMKGPMQKEQIKRKKIDQEAKMITEPECLEEFKKEKRTKLVGFPI